MTDQTGPDQTGPDKIEILRKAGADARFLRFAVYDPGPSALARLGADWLGWDAKAGRPCAALAPGHWTAGARRYGFHATIKAPFRLAKGRSAADLAEALQSLAASLAPLDLPGGLVLTDPGGFLALVPNRQPAPLTELAARVVRDLDPMRAPLTDAEIARRRPHTLSSSGRDNLARWGYPHVMQDFRWHMTLTGPLAPPDAAAARAKLMPLLDAVLTDPHPVTELALMGEDAGGFFHEITRCRLGR